MNFSARQRFAAQLLAGNKVDALIVTHLPNVRYLCGFTGSAGVLVVMPGKNLFVTDGRYTAQAREEVRGAKIAISKVPALAFVAEWLRSNRVAAASVEADHLTAAQRDAFVRAAKGVRIRNASGLVERLRMTKDRDELKLIHEAVVAGASLLTNAVEATRPGVREMEVAAEIEYAARKAGAEAMSFETIVASGARSALPHGRASRAKIGKGFVVLDFGVILHGYCSDMTRTVHVGRASRDMQDLYDAVLMAQLAAIDAVRPGITVGDVDAAARSVLKTMRLARYFTHSTGHGVGLEIHEAPRVSAGGTEELRPGMVITIEPGAYIAGKGGVRIEDMVAVTERGCEVLTPAPKELIEI